ncbi:MAG: EAL domain-containing protein [Gammaproteobacteria bacterium]|nr:EAL domain-containing protein [Gammaproteobacteria bacterium]
MQLKTKVLATVAVVFIGHFILAEYMSHQQIRNNVVSDIRDDAHNIRGMLMALRNVYQKHFIDHKIPITKKNLGFLPAHSISRISKDFRNWVDTGLSFNNVSDVPRNPDNMADELELEAMAYFRNNHDQNERLVSFTNANGEPFYHLSQPIWIEKQCLKCHGDMDEALDTVRENYTTAYGYKLGDLRGLMSIKLPASIIEERIRTQLINSAYSHFGGFLVTYIILSWLLQGTVLSRISMLKDAALRMASGDYTSSVKQYGNDEISQVSSAFDEMARRISKREHALEIQKSLYSALSKTSRSITRRDSQDELFADVCSIAAEYGAMDLACIGLLDDKWENLVVIGSSEQGLINASLPIEPDESDVDDPVMLAISDDHYVVVNDVCNISVPSVWQSVFKQYAMHAVAIFPLRQSDNSIGVFCVFAKELDFFTDDSMGLLNKMASEVSFAVQNYKLGYEYRETHERLQKSMLEMRRLNDQMSLLLESTGDGIYGVDNNGVCTFVNQSALNMLGFTRDELIGKRAHDFIHHSYADGSPYPSADCPVYGAFQTGTPCRVQKEVLWCKDGTSFPVEYSSYPIIEDGSVLGAVTVFRDVTDSHAMEERLSFLATHDPLTKLLNRYAFEQSLKQVLQDAHTNKSHHVLCYMDLDQFKIVNDTCGHVAGDAMLQMISKLLQKNIRQSDILARLGGDEFGLLLENCTLEQAELLTMKICDALKEFRFSWDDKTFTAGVSVGIAAISDETINTDLVMSAADAACYVAKDMGRNRVHIHMADDDEVAKRQGEMQWVSEIQSAIEEGRLHLHRQSIMSLNEAENERDHFEILLRMHDKDGRDIPPGAFIPAAERYALMPVLDRWVINKTFAWLQDAQFRGKQLGLCAINLSGHSLGDGGLKQYIVAQLNAYDIPAEKVCFEITETTAVSRLDQAIHFIGDMRELGCKFALDDFGTGMSSFAYLKNLPVDFLKIDGGFVKDIMEDPVDCGMVESINQIGHLMGLRTIAEYVENDQIRERLAEIGVDYVQGFGVARPGPLD